VRFQVPGADTLAQLVVARLVFCSNEKLVDGMTHETTSFVPEDALCKVGATIVCAVEMFPCCTTVASLPPSAEEAIEV
jgi:hypothetical protein